MFNGFHYLSLFFVGCSNKGESIPRELRLSGVLTLVLVRRFSTCPRNGNCPEYKESSCEILGSPRNHLRSSFTLFVLPKVQSLHSSMIFGGFSFQVLHFFMLIFLEHLLKDILHILWISSFQSSALCWFKIRLEMLICKFRYRIGCLILF